MHPEQTAHSGTGRVVEEVGARQSAGHGTHDAGLVHLVLEELGWVDLHDAGPGGLGDH